MKLVFVAICEGWHLLKAGHPLYARVGIYSALLTQLYDIVGILLACGKHLHDSIMSLRGDAYTYKTSLTPPLVIEVHVPSR